jgi:hypothetical protein
LDPQAGIACERGGGAVQSTLSELAYATKNEFRKFAQKNSTPDFPKTFEVWGWIDGAPQPRMLIPLDVAHHSEMISPSIPR